MAKAKKDKKSKGGPRRKSYLKSMSAKALGRGGRGGVRATGSYTKYGDVDPREVYDKPEITYRGRNYDQRIAPLSDWSNVVYRGAGKEYFIHRDRFGRGGLYKSDAGRSPESVQV